MTLPIAALDAIAEMLVIVAEEQTRDDRDTEVEQ